MSKYDPLRHHLMNLRSDEWHASFDEIERLLGCPLPPSARRYQAWWGDEKEPRSPQKLAYQNAGWHVAGVSMVKQTVTFARVGKADRRSRRKAQRQKGSLVTKLPISVSPEEPTNVSIRFAWNVIGEVTLDRNGRLKFPAAPTGPGLYRFTVQRGNRPAVYVGETDQLRRRFQHYRTPGPSQPTNLRLNKELSDALEMGGSVSVAVVAEGAIITLGGKERSANLSDKAQRVLLEHAALAIYGKSDVEVLNR